MMTGEEFMDIRQMHADGMTYLEIAQKTGYHRTTISEWIRKGHPPGYTTSCGRSAPPAGIAATP
jgi:transposase